MRGSVESLAPAGSPRYDAPEASPVLDRTARALQGLVLVLFVVFAISTIPGVRSSPDFNVALDGWVQGTAYVAMAVLAVLRPFAGRQFRLLCSLIAIAITLRVVAFLVYWTDVRLQDPQPYPSVSDAGWLSMSVVLLVGVGLRIRDRAPLLSLPILLDALIGGLVTAGVATAVLFPVLVRLTRPGTSAQAVAVNMAYPLLDVALLIASVGLLTAARWRPAVPEAVLVVGVLLFAIGDTTYLYEFSQRTFHPGTWLSSMSFLATALIASAGWIPGSFEAMSRPSVYRKPGLVAPVTFSLVAVLALVYAGILRLAEVKVATSAISLLALAVLLGIVRAVVTVVQDRRLLGTATEEALRFQALVEASNDFIAIALLDGQVVYVNPAGRRLVGLPSAVDVTRTTIMDYLTEEGREASLEIEQPAVKANGFWTGESTLRNGRGGPPTPVAINSFLMRHPTTGEPFALATVQRDIRERIRAQAALQDLADQRQQLLARLVQAQEDERARIAADVHDDSVQALAAVDLRLGLLRRKLEGSPRELVEMVEKSHDALLAATGRLRELLFDLESPAQDTDLATALATAAEHVFEDGVVRWSLDGDASVDLPEAPRVTAYRVVKEALVNVRKHADAGHVEIALGRAADGVLVTVTDDGSGFVEEGAPRRGHLGLGAMRDRAAVAGGWLEIDGSGRPGGGTGTVVRLWLPTGAP